jgi:hypothetical protein
MGGTQTLAVGARCLAGDPLALARGGGDAPVERAGKLEMKERPPILHPQQEAGIDLGRLGGALAHLHDDARCLEPGVALPFHPGIGILQRRDDAGDAGCHQGIGAGRRATVVRARLERDIDRGALQGFAGARASTSACGRPPSCVRPRAITRPSRTITHPTDGLGQVRPSDRRASASAARIILVSP